MQLLKPHPIDLQADYPCPCGRKGKLLPITLTEAFGCNRCHHIFNVDEDHVQLQQLSTANPSQKTWYWTGEQWKVLPQSLKHHWQNRLPSLFLALLIGGLLFTALSLVSVEVLLGVVFGAILCLMVLSVWLHH